MPRRKKCEQLLAKRSLQQKQLLLRPAEVAEKVYRVVKEHLKYFTFIDNTSCIFLTTMKLSRFCSKFCPEFNLLGRQMKNVVLELLVEKFKSEGYKIVKRIIHRKTKVYYELCLDSHNCQ